ncbi:MAG TPA: hypothetical protein VNN74_06555 [Candidatus Micrarchaeia archaeon]|nr:hypothetical protein [Candidatus Micrarchaeia archaeon]
MNEEALQAAQQNAGQDAAGSGTTASQAQAQLGPDQTVLAGAETAVTTDPAQLT